MPPAPSSTASSSLARSTLITMGVRIAVVIALTTFFSYLHIFQSFRAETLAGMERSVLERSQREQAIFLLAQDNHTLLKRAFEERLRTLGEEELGARFDGVFVFAPDGTIRRNPQGFDGTRMPGVYVPKGVTADAEFRRRLLAAYDVVSQYGPAFHARFTNTGIMLPEGVVVGYWPEGPNYFQELDASFSIRDLEYFTVAQPQNNPGRASAWTGVFEDAPTKTWMVTVTTPLDIEGHHVATLSHDVLLNDLMRRTLDEHLLGGHNMLFRDDGLLIAHPELRVKSGVEPYNIQRDPRPPEAVFEQTSTPEQRAHLQAVFERVKARAPGETVLELPEFNEFIAVARLEGPGWNLVTVLPESVVSSAAIRAARYVLAFGLASLLLELAIMYWVLQRQIARPLLDFTQASEALAAGDFKVGLDTSRQDELGRLADAFLRMTREVQRREEALRQANEGLEQRVEERTRELKEVHRQFVETARQVGRAEVATNVLHNVGNVLNSVQTSALVAQERLARMKFENVERTVTLFEENRADLSAFLSQDARGRHALPFLRQLGQHLQGEREELRTLLGDISRHTEHIGSIVKLQQQYARTPLQMHEPVDLGELVEDALRINQAALGRHAVQVERHLVAVPPILTEKHKVLMILVNLISNAKYAMDAVPEDARRLTVTMVRPSAERIHIEVRDNGVGIAPELLTRIFQYGFTTREEGHGFGLHSSALAAQELGGSLTAHSDGPGQGAAFTLSLPTTPPAKPREPADA
ncbi:ATP-binding protein [Myxococcaceae bacterium GXIMD 01537]